MEEKKYKSDLELVREGSILKEYNIGKNFVNVTPSPSIGKVKISTVKLGTGGSEHADFYLDIDEFRQLCNEIDSGLAQKKILSETSQYPSAYKWTAGNNGSKHFNIGKSKANGVVFQVQNNATKQNMMVSITPHAFKKMAFLFQLLMGLIPVTAKTYYSNLIYEFYVNEAKRSSYYKKDLQEGDFDSYDEPVADTEGNRESTAVPSGQNAASAKNSFEGTKPFTPQETSSQPVSGYDDEEDPFREFEQQDAGSFIGSNGLAGWGNPA